LGLLVDASEIAVISGDMIRARSWLEEACDVLRSPRHATQDTVPRLAWAAHRIGAEAELLDVWRVKGSFFERVGESMLRGELPRAIDMVAGADARTLEAALRLQHAERCVRDGDLATAGAELRRAETFYREVNATWWLEQCRELAARSAEQTARYSR
jgi:hypothetical protein